MLAIPWYFEDTLGDRGMFGKLFTAVTFISIWWGVYSGILVDRYNRKKLFLAENITGACFLLAIGAYGFSISTVPVALVCLTFAITVFIYNVHYPTLYAFAQELVEPKDYKKITSYIEIQGQLASMAAGGCAAILLSGVEGGESYLGGLINLNFDIEAWPLYRIFLVDGLSYMISILCILMITYESTKNRKAEIGSALDRLKIGISFLRDNPLIFLFGVAGGILFATVLILNFYLSPGYINEILNGDGTTYGLGELGWALGSVLAGVFIRFLFTKKSEVFVVVLLTIIAVLAYISLISFDSIYLFYALITLLGFTNAGSRIMRVSFLLKLVPNQLIGRANSVTRFVGTFFRFLLAAALTLPFFVDHILVSMGILAACCAVAVVVILIFYKRLIALSPSDIVSDYKDY